MGVREDLIKAAEKITNAGKKPTKSKIDKGTERERKKPTKSKSEAVAERARANVNKAYGDGSFVSGLNASSNVKLWFRTGIDALDCILGGKGFASGRIVELFGEPQVGKSTISCLVMAEAQRRYEALGVVIDSEGTLTSERAKFLGVNMASYVYGEEVYIERTIGQIQTLVESLKGHPAVVIWDTIAQTMPLSQKGKKPGEGSLAAHARAISDGIRRVNKDLVKSNVLFLIVNQQRAGGIGNPFVSSREKRATLGGGSIHFAAEQRIGVTFKRDDYKKVSHEGVTKTVPVGFEAEALLEKNKSGPMNVVCRLVMTSRVDGRINNALSTLRTLQYWGVVKKDDSGGRVEVLGKKLLDNQFEFRYNQDDAFRDEVRNLMKAGYEGLYLGRDGEPSPNG